MLEITVGSERQVLTIGKDAVNALMSGAVYVYVLTSAVDSASFEAFAAKAKDSKSVALLGTSDNAAKLAQNVKYRAKARKLALGTCPLTTLVDGEEITIGHRFRIAK